MRPCTHLLTQNNQCRLRLVYDLVSRLFREWFCLPFHCHLVGPKIINVPYRWYFSAASRGLRCYCTPFVIQGTLMRQATEMLTMTMIMIKTLQMMAIMRKTMCKCRFCNIFYVFFKYFGGHLGFWKSHVGDERPPGLNFKDKLRTIEKCKEMIVNRRCKVS